jgi:uncharacterized protein
MCGATTEAARDIDGFARPVPQPDAVSQGFWDAAERGELAIQRCANCRVYQHPPRPVCRACGGTDLGFEPVSGEGRIWSWTVTHHSVLKGFEAAIPYSCLIIELIEQEGLFLISDLIGREGNGESLRIGSPMRVVFPRTDRGPILPQFVPAVTKRGERP